MTRYYNEWVMLVEEAKNMGITKEEIFKFLRETEYDGIEKLG